MALADPTYARPTRVASVAECDFYHTMLIPGHGLVHGQWDLRGGGDDCVGHVPLAGRRVIEIGPASGYLTFHMEAAGAEVVAVELAPDADWDVVPHARIDHRAVMADRRANMARLRNGFWFAHERFGSRARVHYGSAYHLPPALGRFDVALMSCVLLHLREPLRVIEACAALADTVVVTDLYEPDLDGPPLARFYPSPESTQWDTWWRFSPQFFSQSLAVLGHEEVTIDRHEQTFLHEGASYRIPLFTVVAGRSS